MSKRREKNDHNAKKSPKLTLETGCTPPKEGVMPPQHAVFRQHLPCSPQVAAVASEGLEAILEVLEELLGLPIRDR